MADAAGAPQPPPPTAPPAAPTPAAKWGDADDAVAGLTAGMESADAGEVEVDEPEHLGLQERPDDQIMDNTNSSDALKDMTIDTFNSPQLALPESLLKGLYEMNFVRPSRIQAISLPKIWSGRNLLAQSHNGTGKTACFVLGMLRAVNTDKKPQALCLCPTRELAKQIANEAEKMGKYLLQETGVSIKTILREEKHERGTKLPQQIVIGTPGKVWSLIGIKVLDTADIKVFVLDEADEMLLLGGQGDMTKKIRSRLPKPAQNLFFSATWTQQVMEFGKTLGNLSAGEWAEVKVQAQGTRAVNALPPAYCSIPVSHSSAGIARD